MRPIDWLAGWLAGCFILPCSLSLSVGGIARAKRPLGTLTLAASESFPRVVCEILYVHSKRTCVCM